MYATVSRVWSRWIGRIGASRIVGLMITLVLMSVVVVGTSDGAVAEPRSQSSYQEEAAKHAPQAELELAPHDPQPMVALPKTEGFEGPWPNDWALLATEAKYWGPNECLAYQGSYDGWPARFDGDGYPSHTDPPACTAPAGYPYDFQSFMVYGPFSTVGAALGAVDFKALIDTETGYDWGGVIAKAGSADCTDLAGYDGPLSSGNSGGWIDWSEDLSNFSFVGNLLGQANVCIAFLFLSDSSITDVGFFLDNINIWTSVDGGLENDDKANAIVIPEPIPYSNSQSPVGATTELGEPLSCGDIGSTVWYEFTPSQNLDLAADTFTSAYDTVLAVYTGTPGVLPDPGDLVGCNDDTAGFQSRVDFAAAAGTTYQFQVGGFEGDTGSLVFNLGEPPPPPLEECTLSGPQTLVLTNLPEASAASEQPPVLIPRRVPQKLATAGEAAGEAPEANVIDGSATAGIQPLAAPPIGTSFEGLDYNDNPFGLTPPDPQIAVGPDHVFEMVNVTGRIYSKAGAVINTFTLRDFFGLDPGLWLDTDPKVIYDDISGRWVAIYLASDDSTIGAIYLSVSQTSDATGGWNVYRCDYDGLFPDYPGLGLTNDKVTVSSNLFDLTSGFYVAEHTFVIEKADVVAGLPAASVGLHNFPYQPDRFTVRPAHTLSSASDQYLATFDVSSGLLPAKELTVIRVSGSPGAGNVVENTWNVTLTNSQDWPPFSETDGGGSIHSLDFRLLEAIWRDGSLWGSAAAACVPPGDTETRSCAHLIEVNTSSQTLLNDILFGAPGEYFSFPAIRTDSDNNLHVSLTHTTPSIWAEARVAGRLATDPPNTMSGSTLLRAGEVLHDSGRWGDYLGAAVDPVDPCQVWVVGEYAKDTSALGWDWGTYIGQLQYPECGGVGDGIVVRMGSGSVSPGDTITLDLDALDVDLPPGPIGAFTIEVGYDPALAPATACTPDPDGIFDFANCSPNFAPGVARCTGVSILGVSGPVSTLCDITFTADPGAPIPPDILIPLPVTCAVLTDPGGGPLDCLPEDGLLTIVSFVQGDVNCDEISNVVDALFILQYEVGLRAGTDQCPLPPEPPPWLYLPACDVSDDGLCNVVDALFILQCEVGIPNPFCPAPVQVAPQEATSQEARPPQRGSNRRL